MNGTWSFNAPKKQGWYWWRWLGHIASRPEPVRLLRNPRNGNLYALTDEGAKLAKDLDGDWWSEQLTEPPAKNPQSLAKLQQKDDV